MKPHIQVLALGFTAITVLTTSRVHARTWKSADGKSTIEGDLIEFDAVTGQVTLDREGKKISFKREFLSRDDIAFLAENATASRFAGPPPGSKWQPVPELTDEFEDNKLDATKWHDHNPGWKGREPGLFSPKNVSVSDGKLHLTSRVETLPDLPKGFHTFTTAAVKSKALVRYGYFEIKCRPMKSQASSAFWFYCSDDKEWTEIDVFEICGAGGKWHNSYNMTVHVFRTPTETKHWQKGSKWIPPFQMADDYHIYALEWNKEVIKWRVDGEVVREMKNTHWHQALHMNFDSETFPDWFGLPDKESLPATFSIEYVRSWRRPEDG